MDLTALITSAANGKSPSEDLSLAHLALYEGIRELYRYARATGMPVEEAKREKQLLINAFRRARAHEEYTEKCQRNWMRIEAAADAFGANPNRTMKEAEDFYEAVCGCCLKHRQTER